MRIKESRRQFIHRSIIVLAAACCSCRDQNHTNSTTAKVAQPQGTNAASRWPDNVAGRFYVTEACIDCDLCKETAPANFVRNEKKGHAYVGKQPAGDSELRACLEAVEGCPVEAIVDTAKQV